MSSGTWGEDSKAVRQDRLQTSAGLKPDISVIRSCKLQTSAATFVRPYCQSLASVDRLHHTARIVSNQTALPGRWRSHKNSISSLWEEVRLA